MELIKYLVYKKVFKHKDFYEVFVENINAVTTNWDKIDDIRFRMDSKELKISVCEPTDLSFKSKVNPDGEILLSDIYCSYLWGKAYYLLVTYDYAMLQYQKVHGIDCSTQLRPDIDMDYGAKCLNYYMDHAVAIGERRWGLYPNTFAPLPNPFYIEERLNEYILKANGVFTNALAFTLTHEYKHAYYNEHQYDSSLEQAKRDEIDADFEALTLYGQIEDDKHKLSYAAGVAVSLLAIFDSERILNIIHEPSDAHLPTISRLISAIENLNLTEEDALYSFCAFAICQMLGNRSYSDQIFVTPKEYFKHVVRSLKQTVG